MHDVNEMCAFHLFPHSLYLQSPGSSAGTLPKSRGIFLSHAKESLSKIYRDMSLFWDPNLMRVAVANSLERVDKLHWKYPIFNWNCLVDLQINCSQNLLVCEQIKAAKNICLYENLACWKWLS